MSIKDLVADIYPLSPMQEGMLFHTLLAPESGVYLLQTRYLLNGTVEVESFRQAWQRAVDRHPVLRTAFMWENLEKPVQVVYKEVPLLFETCDWQNLAAGERERQTGELLATDRKTGFDLSKAPLIRLRLIRHAAQSYELIFTYHHLLLDAWSGPQLLGEIFNDYSALVSSALASSTPDAGGAQALPTRRPYRDYIAWLQAQSPQEAESFWRRQLAGFHTPTPLPSDRPASEHSASSGAHSTLVRTLPDELTSQLAATARRYQVTMNSLLQSTWGLLLSSYSGSRDVLFGVVTSGRPTDLRGADSMIGLFINTVPVRVQLTPGTTLPELWQSLQQRQIELQQYEFCPLVDVQSWSEVPRSQKLFDSIFIFANVPNRAGLTPHDGLAVEALGTDERTNFGLTLDIHQREGLEAHLIFELDRFDPSTAERLLGHFRQLLERTVERPEQSLEELTPLPPAERQQLVREWNDSAAAPPAKLQLHHFFEAQAASRPGDIALVWGDTELTYGELNRRANRLAHHLIDLRVGPEVRVGLCLERSVEMIVSMLAVLKAGGAYVAFDPAYPRQRNRFILADAEAPVLLTQERFLDALADVGATLVCVDAATTTAREDNPQRDLSPSNLAYVLYTSGSTGRPKGVGIAHASACHLMGWARQVLTDHDLSGVVASTSICFDVSVFEIFATLSWGGRLHLLNDVLALPQHAATHAVRVMCTVPSAMEELVELGLPPSLHKLFLAGEPLSDRLTQRLYREDGVHHVIDAYGPSEDTTYSTWCLRPRGGDNIASIGRPLTYEQAFVVDPNLATRPIGIEGELCLGGAGLARGYLHRPARTATRFIPDPFAETPGRRLYRTGDLARHLADGSLEFRGRIDHQIKLRGFRIELGEIETALQDHPQVRLAAVAVKPSPTGAPGLVGYVVPQNEAPEATELRDALHQRLPAYMLPTSFVVLDKLPTTPTGKLDRAALPAPQASRAALEASYVAPKSQLERDIAAVWCDVLGVERIGTSENFFDAGGHSLAMVKTVGKLRRQLGLELTLVDAFRFPSISQLATHLSRRETAPSAQQNRQQLAPKIDQGKRRMQQRLARQRQAKRRVGRLRETGT
ncbi:MAG: amino acid adenylation domain-containing protein [Acidobacteriota bacterium]